MAFFTTTYKKTLMKSIFTILLSLMLFTSAFAQNFYYEPTSVLNKTIVVDNLSDLKIHIIRENTVDTLHLKYELITNTLPSEWSAGYCDNHGCWGTLPLEGEMSPLYEDLNSYIELSIIPNGVEGSGTVEYYVYEAEHYEDGLLMTFNVDTPGFVGITENPISTFQFYPNPFTNQLNISSSSTINEVAVHDITGKLVNKSSGFHSNDANLDSQDWNSGIYLIEITTSDGLVETRKVSKK